MEQRFDRVITRKGTNCVKFDTAADRGYPEDVLPLFIADMDFQVPESVQEALTADVQKGIFGYSIFDKGYFPAIARWMETHFGWRPEENWLVTTPGVVFAIATAVRSLTEIGDGVLIQPPVYPPFFSTVTENGRRLVESPLVQENGTLLVEDGSYSTPEKVAEYLHFYGHLPQNYLTKQEAKALGWAASQGNLWEVAEGKSIGGDRFGNREGLLPEADGRTWYECDVNYMGGFRGAERLLYSSDGLIYYTDDHYASFTLVYGEEETP